MSREARSWSEPTDPRVALLYSLVQTQVEESEVTSCHFTHRHSKSPSVSDLSYSDDTLISIQTSVADLRPVFWRFTAFLVRKTCTDN